MIDFMSKPRSCRQNNEWPCLYGTVPRRFWNFRYTLLSTNVTWNSLASLRLCEIPEIRHRTKDRVWLLRKFSHEVLGPAEIRIACIGWTMRKELTICSWRGEWISCVLETVIQDNMKANSDEYAQSVIPCYLDWLCCGLLLSFQVLSWRMKWDMFVGNAWWCYTWHDIVIHTAAGLAVAHGVRLHNREARRTNGYLGTK